MEEKNSEFVIGNGHIFDKKDVMIAIDNLISEYQVEVMNRVVNNLEEEMKKTKEKAAKNKE